MLPAVRVMVVMPAYNAARTLERTYADIPLDLVSEVIVVDDASHDDTAEQAHRLGLRVLVHHQNLGYGANQKTCYREALNRGAEVVVMVHADHQYDPTRIPALSALGDGPGSGRPDGRGVRIFHPPLC